MAHEKLGVGDIVRGYGKEYYYTEAWQGIHDTPGLIIKKEYTSYLIAFMSGQTKWMSRDAFIQSRIEEDEMQAWMLFRMKS